MNTVSLTWRSRLVLWLLRRVLKWERTTLSVEFGWNAPGSGERPFMGVITKIHSTGTTVSIIYMEPTQARMLCQNGLEELDAQLERWQAYWRTRDGERPTPDSVGDVP